jgi:hypothetical protein
METTVPPVLNTDQLRNKSETAVIYGLTHE